MNGRTAKSLRRWADSLTLTYVKDRLLPEDLTKGEKRDRLLNVVPQKGYYTQFRQVRLGVMSRDWIRKQVKKHPEITYEQLLKKAMLT